MTCEHGIMAHRSDPKPEFTKVGGLLNTITWRCLAIGCACHFTIKSDRPEKPAKEPAEVQES